MSVLDYKRETAEDRAARRERAILLTSGPRGRDGLTDLERNLLESIRAMGYELVATEQYPRFVRKAA